MRYNIDMATYRVDTAVTAEDSAAVWEVYDAVFGDCPTYREWLDRTWERHVPRAGFRLARAYDGASLVGFAYGYTGEDGQWWTDQARTALPPDVAETWLGGHFEVVSLAVAARARRRGIGRRLLHALLDGLPHDRLLLMTTAHASDPARRLYDSEGWRVVGPGITEATVIMARRGGETRAGRDRSPRHR